jgi:hypothetical protein
MSEIGFALTATYASSAWVIDPGTYVLHAAASATDLRLSTPLRLR